ncbi:protein AMN1 homolog [Petromyzon marinus]|uniref:protein AMN1 homolog n=1 Tax=Petromyzon marinus TaxID=7757 RepID=UPI003F6F5500
MTGRAWPMIVDEARSPQTLLTASLQIVARAFPRYSGEVEQLPHNLKTKLLYLLVKQGEITDQNIGKFVNPQVKKLNFSRCRITDECLRQLTSCKLLLVLILNNTNVTSEGVEILAACCPLLRDVELSQCTELTDRAIIKLAASCPQLWILNLRGCHRLGDASLHALGRASSSLQFINFAKTQVTDEGVIALVNGACSKSLEEVHMDHCPSLTDKAVEAVLKSCPQIKYLHFHECPLMTEHSRVILDDYMQAHNHLQSVTWTVYWNDL